MLKLTILKNNSLSYNLTMQSRTVCFPLFCLADHLRRPRQWVVCPEPLHVLCCAPPRTVRHAQDREKGDSNNPRNKRLQFTPITKYISRYIAGGGPIKQQCERGPPYHHNIQENVLYKIPYQHPAPTNPAIYCASQHKGTHITTVLPPIRERLSSDAQVPVKKSP